MTIEPLAASASLANVEKTHHHLSALCREYTAQAVRALIKIAKGDQPAAARMAAAELHRRGLANLIDPEAEPRLPDGYVFALMHGRWPTDADFIEGAAEPRLTHEQRVEVIEQTPNILMGEIGK